MIDVTTDKESVFSGTDNLLRSLLENDPFLRPYEEALKQRIVNIHEMKKRLTQGKTDLAEFAAGHEYFGLHFSDEEWIFREWAPNATALYLVGDMTGWLEKAAFALDRIKKMVYGKSVCLKER